MARICLNVLVGIPASGKTTYCQQIESTLNRTFNVVHVCYDTYIEIDSKFDMFCSNPGSYKSSRQMLVPSVEAIISTIMEGKVGKTLDSLLGSWQHTFGKPLEISSSAVPSEDYLFLIDDNNYYRSMRWDWARLAKKLSLGFLETYFDTLLPVALERNVAREHPVSEDVLTRMWTRLEKPCGKLFRWEQNTIIIQEQLDMGIILSSISNRLENPEKAADPSPTNAFPMEQSKVHKLDILLRKAISKNTALIKDSMAKHQLRSYVELLQERKNSILHEFRHAEQHVPDEMFDNLVEELF
ncbi:L-seryl-tRNA(Sec) kinase [Anopheles ziemanni]|uniref:L-seryl-tRNA(Sec) kinase n=1 Tax=Anopheles coustani TaxID=139045 RepID=UPI002658E4D5|nr:L-seryl-tRNA(Sec) kinase [Anopheles coustani]XP_058171874.1 L-seryl-tRNA(Sec) kinase [Anopheles ziemanni]